MTNLKKLTFTEVPKNTTDLTIKRREKLVERLQEQINLAKDPTYAVKGHKWEPDETGKRTRMDQYIPNPGVAGSNPARDTNFSNKTNVFYIYFSINIEQVFKNQRCLV